VPCKAAAFIRARHPLDKVTGATNVLVRLIVLSPLKMQQANVVARA
jgi:hypothetical protein